MKKISLLLYITLLACSCSRLSDKEKEIKRVLNCKLEIEDISEVIYEDDTLTIDALFNEYNYLSIVYVKDMCTPCEEKFIKWNKWAQDKSLSVLYVIQGYSYDAFIKKVKHFYPDVKPHYYMMDPHFKYEDNNSKVPLWILERSILIDKRRRIKIIGEPYVSKEMEELYFQCIGS